MSTPLANARRMLSAKTDNSSESVICEMTRLALKVNLSQGLSDCGAHGSERSRAPGHFR
jgi:hypothetical protein